MQRLQRDTQGEWALWVRHVILEAYVDSAEVDLEVVQHAGDHAAKEALAFRGIFGALLGSLLLVLPRLVDARTVSELPALPLLLRRPVVLDGQQDVDLVNVEDWL